MNYSQLKHLALIITLLSPLILGADAKLYPALIGDKTGYINLKGEWHIEPEFDVEFRHISYTHRGRQYQTVQFPDYTFFSDGIATVIEDETFLFIFTIGFHYSCINEYGEILFETERSLARGYINGVSVIEIPLLMGGSKFGQKFGFIDKAGGFIFNYKFDYAAGFREGFALVLSEGYFGFIDESGEYVIEPQFDDAFSFSDGLAAVRKGNYFGYIDKTGKLVIDYKYEKAFDFDSGAAMVYVDGKFGYINKKGEYLLKPDYREAMNFKEGLATVKVNGKWGCIDNRGFWVIEPKYSAPVIFSEGLAAVENLGMWGFIKKDNKFVIQPGFEFAVNFKSGFAQIWEDRVVYLINKSGEKIFEYYNPLDYPGEVEVR